jgi:hypothetical protein
MISLNEDVSCSGIFNDFFNSPKLFFIRIILPRIEELLMINLVMRSDLMVRLYQYI